MTVAVTDVVDPGPVMCFDGAPGGRHALGGTVMKIMTLTYASTYLTGGDAISPGACRMSSIVDAMIEGQGGLIYDPIVQADGSLVVKKWRRGADTSVLAELPNATANAEVVRMLVIGRA